MAKNNKNKVKLRVFGTEIIEKVTRLKMMIVDESEQAIDIVAVDGRGKDLAPLIRIDVERGIMFHTSIPDSIGLPLDCDGCVRGYEYMDGVEHKKKMKRGRKGN